ncbi:Endonuclease V, putative [Perkinsus marinus ATCC 50983]|uniref:Endonuclease V, putative n=1 Tax=Perkinsus marinus (strain ATCC 50983 / TXsc) TaxID=423536 RepID=C5K6D6_PERM5|nr:Endonuclease V, putative [Perkinsus marinus ATCC 50983]EER19856.1 Endonuclease V, putative [Perkinsus marinus ATCC 50983]|eukprot:XP_002788060.1 Endonuclease V, putative [Perkinsus marinus ATCC 50983]
MTAPARWVEEQERIRSRVVVGSCERKPYECEYVGGFDITSDPTLKEDFCVAGLVIVHLPSRSTVYEDYISVDLSQPYVPGFLAFRECEPMLELIRRVPPEQRLDVIMVDGNGLLHPRRCGAACHLGVLADIPSIGVAKNYYCSIPATPSRDELKDRARRELCGMGDYFFIEDADDVTSLSDTAWHCKIA